MYIHIYIHIHTHTHTHTHISVVLHNLLQKVTVKCYVKQPKYL